MREMIDKMMHMAKELEEMQAQKLDMAHKALKDIEDDNIREFLRKSMVKAMNGKLDLNTFVSQVNKLTKQ